MPNPFTGHDYSAHTLCLKCGNPTEKFGQAYCDSCLKPLVVAGIEYEAKVAHNHQKNLNFPNAYNKKPKPLEKIKAEKQAAHQRRLGAARKGKHRDSASE